VYLIYIYIVASIIRIMEGRKEGRKEGRFHGRPAARAEKADQQCAEVNDVREAQRFTRKLRARQRQGGKCGGLKWKRNRLATTGSLDGVWLYASCI
jgi:hypothetical protein